MCSWSWLPLCRVGNPSTSASYRLDLRASLDVSTCACYRVVLVVVRCSACADGLGVPAYFFYTLTRYSDEMRRDIMLWQRGLGDSAATNTDYWIRRRYSRLYIDYKPQVHWWRLVLIVRKGCLVTVSVLFSHNPTFQAAAVLACLLVAYTLHVRNLPFLTALSARLEGAGDLRGKAMHADSQPAALVTRRASVFEVAAVATRREVMRQILDLNVLETTMLRCSVFVLLGGLMFASGAFGAEDTAGSTVVALLVGALVVGSSLLFTFMILHETRTLCQSRRVSVPVTPRGSISVPEVAAAGPTSEAGEDASGDAGGGPAAAWMVAHEPLERQMHALQRQLEGTFVGAGVVVNPMRGMAAASTRSSSAELAQASSLGRQLRRPTVELSPTVVVNPMRASRAARVRAAAALEHFSPVNSTG